MEAQSRLPTEILHQIIDEIGLNLASYTKINDNYWDLRHSLYNVALSCKNLREHCTRRLFHTLVLWGEIDCPLKEFVRRLKLLEQALEIPGGPATYVRTVAITFFTGHGMTEDGEVDHEAEERWWEPVYYDDIITEPFISHFSEALPSLLTHLSGVHTLRLDSQIEEFYLAFASLDWRTRSAIFECMSSNPLRLVQINRFTIPWEVLTSLPKSLERLELGTELCCSLEEGESEGSLGRPTENDYAGDKAMFSSKTEPQIPISPKSIRLRLFSPFLTVISRQTSPFFSRLTSLDFTIDDPHGLWCCHRDILPFVSPHLEELTLRVHFIQFSRNYEELIHLLGSCAQSVSSLPVLKKLGFILDHSAFYDYDVTCPPRFAMVADVYLSQGVKFHHIKVLETIATWNLGGKSFPFTNERPIVDPSESGWDALDDRLAGFPFLEVVKLTLNGEDRSFSLYNLESMFPVQNMRRQTKVEMEALFPKVRARGVKVVTACRALPDAEEAVERNARRRLRGRGC